MKFKASTVRSVIDSPLGAIMLAASDDGLQGAWFVHGQRHMPDASAWPVSREHPLLQQAGQELLRYFCGEAVAFDLPLDLDSGSDFQRRVWRAMLQIPRGSTCSYRALGERIGSPRAVRAVGGAVGRNPLSIFVPCHRVIGGDGSLTGYAGGLDRKVALLQLEGALTSRTPTSPARAEPSPPLS